MIADAEAHRAEDARLRAEVDARNELDAVAHQVERRRLTSSADQVPVHEKARAENLIADARKAVEETGTGRPAALAERRAAAGVPRLGASRPAGDRGAPGAERRQGPAVGRRLTTSSTPTSPSRAGEVLMASQSA